MIPLLRTVKESNFALLHQIYHFVQNNQHQLGQPFKRSVSSIRTLASTSSINYSSKSSDSSTDDFITNIISSPNSVTSPINESVNSTTSNSLSGPSNGIISRYSRDSVAAREQQVQSLLAECSQQPLVSMDDIEEILKLVTLTHKRLIRGDVVHHMLLLCSQDRMPHEQPEQRMKFVFKVWNHLREYRFLTSHYNMLLQAFLENGHRFSATAFLAQLKRRHVPVDNVTWGLLLRCHCLHGEMAIAEDILLKIQDRDAPMDAAMFHTLMMGYIKAGDPAAAMEVLESMPQSGVTPSADSYGALAEAHAQLGDIENFRRVVLLSQQAGADYQLSDRHLLDAVVAFAFATAGHEQHVHEVLCLTSHDRGYNDCCMDAVFRLMNGGHLSAARTLLDSMTGDEYRALYVRHMVKLDMPASSIVSTCYELQLPPQVLLEQALQAALQDTHHLAYPLMEAILHCHSGGPAAHASAPGGGTQLLEQQWSLPAGTDDSTSAAREEHYTRLFTQEVGEETINFPSEMRNSQVDGSHCETRRSEEVPRVVQQQQHEGWGSESPIRPRHFWPLIAHHGDTGNSKEVFTVLQKMRELGVPPCLSTLLQHALPQLLRCVDELLPVVVARLQQQDGLSRPLLVNVALATILRSQDVRRAGLLLSALPTPVTPRLLGELASAAHRSQDWPAAASVLASMVATPSPPGSSGQPTMDDGLEDYLRDVEGEQSEGCSCLVGRFLLLLCDRMRHNDNYRTLVALLQALDDAGLRMSPDALPEVLKRLGSTGTIPQVSAALWALVPSPPDVDNNPPADSPFSLRVTAFSESIAEHSLAQSLQLYYELTGSGDAAEVSVAGHTALLTALLDEGQLQDTVSVIRCMSEYGAVPPLSLTRRAVRLLTDAGDVASLQQLQQVLPRKEQQSVGLESRVFVAKSRSGQAAILLQEMTNRLLQEETMGDLAKSFPSAGFLHLVLGNEHLITQVVEVAEAYRSHGCLKPYSALWTYYCITCQRQHMDQVSSLLSATGGRRSAIPYTGACQVVRERRQPALAARIMRELQRAPHLADSRTRPAIYSCWIDVLCDLDKPEQAVSVLEEALQRHNLAQLQQSTLRRLQQLVEQSGLSFKYAVQ